MLSVSLEAADGDFSSPLLPWRLVGSLTADMSDIQSPIDVYLVVSRWGVLAVASAMSWRTLWAAQRVESFHARPVDKEGPCLPLLLTWRLAITLVALSFGVHHVYIKGPHILVYFTSAAWWALTGYFAVAAVATMLRIHACRREANLREILGVSIPEQPKTAVPAPSLLRVDEEGEWGEETPLGAELGALKSPSSSSAPTLKNSLVGSSIPTPRLGSQSRAPSLREEEVLDLDVDVDIGVAEDQGPASPTQAFTTVSLLSLGLSGSRPFSAETPRGTLTLAGAPRWRGMGVGGGAHGEVLCAPSAGAGMGTYRVLDEATGVEVEVELTSEDVTLIRRGVLPEGLKRRFGKQWSDAWRCLRAAVGEQHRRGKRLVHAVRARLPVRGVDLAEASAVLLFNMVGGVAVMVTVLTRTLLLPMVNGMPEGKEKADWLASIFNVTSYMQHGGNVLLLLIDACLAPTMPTRFDLAASGALFTSANGVFMMIYMAINGVWLYPFFDHRLPIAKVVFLALYAGTWAFVAAFFAKVWVLRRAIKIAASWASRTALQVTPPVAKPRHPTLVKAA